MQNVPYTGKVGLCSSIILCNFASQAFRKSNADNTKLHIINLNDADKE
mgnify:FL=1